MFECTSSYVAERLKRLNDPFSLRRMAGGIILRISHGYTIQEKNDPFVTLADEATEQFSLSTAPGGFLVNLVPPCKCSSDTLKRLTHLPKCFFHPPLHQTDADRLTL